jgi:hypothetical protein
MPKFTVVHGSIKLGSERFAQVGESIELSAEEAKHLGPAVAAEGSAPLKKSTVVAPKKAAEAAPVAKKEGAK